MSSVVLKDTALPLATAPLVMQALLKNLEEVEPV